MGSAAPGRRRLALTGRQARIASIAAVVVAMAATGVAVGLDSHSSSQTNTAATTGPGRGNNPAPFGNSNGSNGFDGRTGQNGQGNGTAPQFGAPGQMGGQNRQGDRRQELQPFLTCLKQNGISIGGNNRPFFDPADPQLRTALTKCASALPFGRFRGGFAGGPQNGTGTGGIGSGGTGTGGTGTGGNGSHGTGTGGIGSSGTGTGGIGSSGTGTGGTSENGSHST
jgi:hypothetical protein